MLTAIIFWLLSFLTPVSVEAQEQRCNELGTNCVCSEPFNANTLTRVAPAFYTMGGESKKPCTQEGAVGQTIARNVANLLMTTDAAILAKMPAGHSVSRVIRGPEGHLNTWYMGMGFGKMTPKPRMAARFYVYHSANFQFAGEGVCENSKMAEMSVGPDPLIFDKSHGSIHLYNFLGWNPKQDCCPGSLGGTGNLFNSAWRDRWWRVEIVAQRSGGQGATTPGTGPVVSMYMRNVTLNTPEFIVINTGAAGTALNPPSQNRNPPGHFTGISINNYRQNGCAGFIADSHYMAASWDTDAGQRIGAASEIEGGGGPPPAPPATPSSLFVRPIGTIRMGAGGKLVIGQ